MPACFCQCSENHKKSTESRRPVWLGPRTSCKKRSETERPFRSPQRLIYEVIELARRAYPPTQPAHINPASQTPSSMPSIVVLKNCSMPRNPKPTAKVPRCSARKGPLSNAPLLPPTCTRFASPVTNRKRSGKCVKYFRCFGFLHHFCGAVRVKFARSSAAANFSDFRRVVNTFLKGFSVF